MRLTDKTYRPDIDGLRAFAVLAVMGFHAAPSSVRGGFVGVDVFFVISGFLITSIILRDLDAEKFSIKNFYVSRICRIFPALIVMLVATLLIGWLILLPDEFKELGRHIAAAPLFSSNFLLLQESGYFERAAEQKPLLHLWSLSIEEQFYLLWPVTLIALWKSRLNLVYLIGLIAFVSFELNIYLMQINPSANFYIPLTRFWEILLGALLAVIIRDKEFIGIISSYFNPPNEKYRSLCRNIMSVLGLLLIAFCILKYKSGDLFPGRRAILPTIGTVLIIAASSKAWLNKKLLSNKMATYIGLISYPLYLWHWPLLVFVDFIAKDLGIKSNGIKLIVLALAWLLADLTYRFIEFPFRKKFKPKTLLNILVVTSFCLFFIGLGMSKWPKSRLSQNDMANKVTTATADYVFPKNQYVINYTNESKRNASVLFIGDSHAQAYYHAIEILAQRDPTISAAFSTKSGCPVLPNVNRMIPGYDCPIDYKRNMASAYLPQFKKIIITDFWHGYVEGVYLLEPDPIDGLSTDKLTIDGIKRASFHELEKKYIELAQELKKLKSMGKEIILISSNPDNNFANPALLLSNVRIPFSKKSDFVSSFPLAGFKKHVAWTDGQLKKVSEISGAKLIDPSIYTCPNGICITIENDQTPIYKDYHHLRGFAIAKYYSFLMEIVK